VQENEKLCIVEKREQIKQTKVEQETKEFQLRQKQLDQPAKEKRFGRPIMAKSMLQKEEKKEKVVEEIPEEELDRIKYFT